jgi:hypothetical protein
VVYPAVRYARISTARAEFRTLDYDDPDGYAVVRFQTDSYALKHGQALGLAQAIFYHLKVFHGTINGMRIDVIVPEDEAGEFEPAVAEGGQGVHRQRLDVLFHHTE